MKHDVVDREGMAAEFLARLSRQGRTIVTVLRTDHYTGFGVVPRGGEFLSFCFLQELSDPVSTQIKMLPNEHSSLK